MHDVGNNFPYCLPGIVHCQGLPLVPRLLRGGGKKNNKKLRAWYTHCLSVPLADSKIEGDGVPQEFNEASGAARILLSFYAFSIHAPKKHHHWKTF